MGFGLGLGLGFGLGLGIELRLGRAVTEAGLVAPYRIGSVVGRGLRSEQHARAGYG